MIQKILMGMGMLADSNTASDVSDITTVTNDTLYAVVNYINSILAGIIGVAIAIGVVYAIVVGAKMARANNAEQREEAKKKVIYTVVGIAIAVALMIILLVLKDQIPSWLGLIKITKDGQVRWIASGAEIPEGWTRAFIGL